MFSTAIPLKTETQILKDIEEKVSALKQQNLVSEILGEETPILQRPALEESTPIPDKKFFVMDEVMLLRTELLAAKRQAIEAEIQLLRMMSNELKNKRLNFLKEENELLDSISKQAAVPGPIVVKAATQMGRGWIEILPVPTRRPGQV